ncbi:prolyl oligopeptidase family serine peptidase [Frateuria defendens]|uniref:carboxylesterase family protein n=1 Tax=Frateuria defendens TaxID=2219559 RepID=UPI00066FEFA8|nr:prolyl oligopeptidase family serine peptidase [Frateuria defendens]
MSRLLFSLLLMTAALAGHAAPRFVERQAVVDGKTYRYQVFVPDGWTAKREWPTALFLHGSGERGTDNRKQLGQGLPPWLREHGQGFPAVVVMPQAPEGAYWTRAAERAALGQSVREFHGDRRRLYLTGLSMGGYGGWQLAVDHPGLFAAAAIIASAVTTVSDEPALRVEGIPPGEADPCAWVARHVGTLPVWIFHGEDDTVVPPAEARRVADVLRALGREVRYTAYPGVNHGSWVPAYATPELWP